MPTFPSKFPLFGLDHILTNRHATVLRAEVDWNKASRIASDHLPLLAEITLAVDRAP